MIKFLRMMTSVAVGLLLVLLSTTQMRAQLCGQSFATFGAADSEGKTVLDVTIEIVAELPSKDFTEFKAKKGYEEYGYFSFRLAPKDADELLKRGVPPRSTKDICGNPLKQRANSTRVKTLADSLNGSAGSVKNFGFCASESNSSITLLKVSAQGYVTDYYLRSYLRGCFTSYSFVLSKAE